MSALLPVAIGLQAASGLFNAIGAAGRPDPTKVYERRIQEALKYLQNVFSGLEIQAKSQAERDMSQVRRVGARQAAALGYTGGSAPFTSPGEASIASRLDNALQSLRSNRALSLANLKASSIDGPIVSRPTAMEYFGAVLGAGSDITSALMKNDSAGTTADDANRELEEKITDIGKRTTGQTAIDGAINRIGDLGAPVSKPTIAGNFFTFGKPFRPTRNYSPLYFGGR